MDFCTKIVILEISSFMFEFEKKITNYWYNDYLVKYHYSNGVLTSVKWVEG